MIGVIVLVFFGPRRLPEIANAIGRSLREFRKALNEVRDEITQSDPSASPSTPDRMDYAAGILERFAGAGARAESPRSEPAAPSAEEVDEEGESEPETGPEAGKGADADPRDSKPTA